MITFGRCWDGRVRLTRMVGRPLEVDRMRAHTRVNDIENPMAKVRALLRDSSRHLRQASD